MKASLRLAHRPRCIRTAALALVHAASALAALSALSAPLAPRSARCEKETLCPATSIPSAPPSHRGARSS